MHTEYHAAWKIYNSKKTQPTSVEHHITAMYYKWHTKKLRKVF